MARVNRFFGHFVSPLHFVKIAKSPGSGFNANNALKKTCQTLHVAKSLKYRPNAFAILMLSMMFILFYPVR